MIRLHAARCFVYKPQVPPDPDTTTTTRRTALGSLFEKTSVDLIRSAASGDGASMNELCSRYWYPLYTWLLSRGLARNEFDAQDLVQDFLVRMIEKGALASHEPGRGRFRSYLLKCLKRYAIDQIRRAKLITVSAPEGVETDWLGDLGAIEASDAAFEKAWAWELFETAKKRLRHQWSAEGEETLFDAYEPHLDGVRSAESLDGIGKRFGLSHDNARMRLHRLRKQLRQLLITLVETDLSPDATPQERTDEMKRFLEALLL
jgi:RNA polymerase sigma factor (sigma-70 family)